VNIAYKSIEKLSDVRIGLLHKKWGKQLWVLCGAKKEHKCCITQQIISKGMECWRPLGNSSNRMKRISEKGMDVIERRLKSDVGESSDL